MNENPRVKSEANCPVKKSGFVGQILQSDSSNNILIFHAVNGVICLVNIQ